MAARLLHHLTRWKNYPLTLTQFYPFVSSTPTSFYLLWTTYPHSYTILPPGQLNSYLTLLPLNKLPPQSYTILSTLAARTSFYPLWTSTPSFLHHFTPLGSPTLTSFYHLSTTYPLNLTSFYFLWQIKFYSFLLPLRNSPHPYIRYQPRQLNPYHNFPLLWATYPSFLNHFTPPPSLAAQHLIFLNPSEQTTP